jgi:hypothetical protein
MRKYSFLYNLDEIIMSIKIFKNSSYHRENNLRWGIPKCKAKAIK